MSKVWGMPATWDEVCRRASGRRRYNADRKLQAQMRRLEVASLMQRWGGGHGVQARIARHLGVSEATISRDVRALLQEGRATRCPFCDRFAMGRPELGSDIPD